MRSHRRSASRYHLILACGWWAREDVDYMPRPVGEAAIQGNEGHKLLEHHAKLRMGEPSEAPSMLGPDSARIGGQACAWLDDVAIPTAVEIAIAYNAENDTARRIEVKGHRDYGIIAPMEIPMTLDLVWVEPGRVVVRDLKTGKREHAHREQLLIQALGASRLYAVPTAAIGFLFARKTKCDADPLETLTEEDLEAVAWQASSTLRRLPMAKPEPGQHCWFCDARPVCPAHDRTADEERPLAG